MNKKMICRVLVIVMALTVTGVFMFSDFGLELTSLTKFFIVFTGLIIGIQSVPAFVGMLKGVPIKEISLIKKTLTNHGENSIKARKILIVDKDSVPREKLVEFFENSHFEVETTASAAYAIAKVVQKHNPIVILGDSFEERIASVEVIALMRKCNKNLRIILISDDSAIENLRQIHENGIYFHTLKSHGQADNEGLRSAVECAVEGFNPAVS